MRSLGKSRRGRCYCPRVIVGGRSHSGHVVVGPDGTPDQPRGVPPSWGVYFAVADADASVRRIRELGGRIFVEPRDIEPGRFAVGTDPQGAVFSVLALKP